MSAAKRRRKAQIKRLQKLDANHSWLYYMKSPRRDGPRAAALWWKCVVPLGDKLERQKPGAWAALSRCAEGKAGLQANFNKRRAAHTAAAVAKGADRLRVDTGNTVSSHENSSWD